MNHYKSLWNILWNHHEITIPLVERARHRPSPVSKLQLSQARAKPRRHQLRRSWWALDEGNHGEMTWFILISRSLNYGNDLIGNESSWFQDISQDIWIMEIIQTCWMRELDGDSLISTYLNYANYVTRWAKNSVVVQPNIVISYGRYAQQFQSYDSR